nr:hypothetical protein CFP56_22469 [Quercus suber]
MITNAMPGARIMTLHAAFFSGSHRVRAGQRVDRCPQLLSTRQLQAYVGVKGPIAESILWQQVAMSRATTGPDDDGADAVVDTVLYADPPMIVHGTRLSIPMTHT